VADQSYVRYETCPTRFTFSPRREHTPDAALPNLTLPSMAPNSDAEKRALTVLTISQIKFKQAMKKEDTEVRLPPVSVEVSSQLFSCIGAVLQQNTRVNVQVSNFDAIDHVSPGNNLMLPP